MKYRSNTVLLVRQSISTVIAGFQQEEETMLLVAKFWFEGADIEVSHYLLLGRPSSSTSIAREICPRIRSGHPEQGKRKSRDTAQSKRCSVKPRQALAASGNGNTSFNAIGARSCVS